MNLPIDQLERLNAIRPDLVDVVIAQLRIQGDSRRERAQRRDWLDFIERMSGVLAAVVIGFGGMLIGGYLGLHGQSWLGASVSGGALGTLAVAFLRREGRTSDLQDLSSTPSI